MVAAAGLFLLSFFLFAAVVAVGITVAAAVAAIAVATVVATVVAVLATLAANSYLGISCTNRRSFAPSVLLSLCGQALIFSQYPVHLAVKFFRWNNLL